MGKRTKSTNELKKASEALHYEITMLNESANKHKSLTDKNGVIRNALIESFCVHLRNFIEFFDVRRNDYITYKHFTSEQSILFKNVLKKNYSKKVNNLLSHLTFERLGYDESKKGWDMQRIANEVNENMKLFLENARADLICDKLKKYMDTKQRQDDKYICTTGDSIKPASLVQHSKKPKNSPKS